MTIKPVFAWYDFWVGIFWDRHKRHLYILPLPCVGVVLKFHESNEAVEPRKNMWGAFLDGFLIGMSWGLSGLFPARRRRRRRQRHQAALRTFEDDQKALQGDLERLHGDAERAVKKVPLPSSDPNPAKDHESSLTCEKNPGIEYLRKTLRDGDDFGGYEWR